MNNTTPEEVKKIVDELEQLNAYLMERHQLRTDMEKKNKVLKDIRMYLEPGVAGDYAEKLYQRVVKALTTPSAIVTVCPQCGDPTIQANLGDGKIDIYCENCGWPDENRKEGVKEE